MNHPLDCPICDQAGECDLQDQSMNFGSDSSRFYIKKRGVEDKNLGPIIKTVMTRCIHCTRCVRFAIEVAGLKDLGTTGRGKKTEIGTYVSKIVGTELSGNIIDLCPVGALTSKVYAFKARPWELKSVNSIDVLDSLGSNIVVQKKGNDIIRILPSLNENLNEEWLTDKARYSFDGIKINRLDSPLLKVFGNKFDAISWENSFNQISEKLKKAVTEKGLQNTKIRFVGNTIMDLDTSYSCELFSKSFKGNVKLNFYKTFNNNSFNKDLDVNYRSSNILESLTKSDLILVVGLNLKEDIPLLWVKLRNYINQSGTPVGIIGNNVDYGFDYTHIGLDNKSLINCIEGNHIFLKEIIKAKNPLIITGENNLSSNFDLISDYLAKINENVGFSVINSNMAASGLFELGFDPSLESDKNDEDICFNIGNTDFSVNPKSFNIFIGSHGSDMLKEYDMVLPSLTYLEQESFFMNFNGIVQKSGKLSKLVAGARKGSNILEALELFLQKSNTEYFFNNSLKNNIFFKFLKKEKRGLMGLKLKSDFSKKFW
jgi:NADH-quinone oxidoreductase chain G